MSESDILDFTLEEDAWWKSAAVDAKHWKDGGGSLYGFVDAALPFWFWTYPYRHPRTSRHTSTTSAEASLVYGVHEWLRIREVCFEAIGYAG